MPNLPLAPAPSGATLSSIGNQVPQLGIQPRPFIDDVSARNSYPLAPNFSLLYPNASAFYLPTGTNPSVNASATNDFSDPLFEVQTIPGFVSPNAPTVVELLTSISTGYEFQFALVPSTKLLSTDGYKIYRSSTNMSTSATAIAYIKHNPTLGVITFQDSQPKGAMYYYWVSAVGLGDNELYFESGLTPLQSTSVPSGSVLNSSGIPILTSSSGFDTQGSLVGACDPSVLSWSATTTSVTWTWSSFSFFFPDGSTIIVPASTSGTQVTVSGLTSGTTYYFEAYYTISSQTVVIVLSTTSSGTAAAPLQQRVQTVQADGNVGIFFDSTVVVPASGTSTGTSNGRRASLYGG